MANVMRLSPFSFFHGLQEGWLQHEPQHPGEDH